MNVPKLSPADLSRIKTLTGQTQRAIVDTSHSTMPPCADSFVKSQESLLGQNKPVLAPKSNSVPPSAEETASFVADLGKLMRK